MSQNSQGVVSSMSTDSEMISVVICAHDRRNYLIEAIQSALNQTVERSIYEVIVVKNFMDDRIDAFMEQNGVISIVSDVPNLSDKQLLGIERSKGEMICFLDDDDLFEPEKLEIVLRTFAGAERTSFVHNGMLFVDPDGNKVQSGKHFAPIIYNSSNYDPGSIKRMISEMASYNASSMTIRRNMAIRYSQYLDKISREVDTFWFLCALDFGETISVIPDSLTRYRRTKGGLSKAADPMKFLKYAEAAILNVESMKTMVSSDSARLFLELKESEWKAKRVIFSRKRGNMSVRFEAITGLITVAALFPVRDLLKLLSVLLLSSVSEDRALRLFSRLYT